MQQVTAWDAEIVDAAERLHDFRSNYFEMLEPCLQAEVKLLLPDNKLVVRYQSGWPVNMSLGEALSGSLEKDQRQGIHTIWPSPVGFFHPG